MALMGGGFIQGVTFNRRIESARHDRRSGHYEQEWEKKNNVEIQSYLNKSSNVEQFLSLEDDKWRGRV